LSVAYKIFRSRYSYIMLRLTVYEECVKLHKAGAEEALEARLIIIGPWTRLKTVDAKALKAKQ